MDIISIFQQRTDFSYAPIRLEINEGCFMFGSEREQTKVDAMIKHICNKDSFVDDLCEGPVKIVREIMVEDILLLLLMPKQKIIKILMKNGDVFFSNRGDLLTVHSPQIYELNKIKQGKSFTLYKRQSKSWVKYLKQHLKAIVNWKMKANYGGMSGMGEMSNIYYLTNNQLVRLGAYSETCLHWFPEDENAIGVPNSMMKYCTLFWE